MISKIKQITYKKEHIELIDIREREYEYFKITPNFAQKLGMLEKLHSAMTLLYDEIVLGVVGYVPIVPGTYEVWLIPSSHISTHSLAFAKLLRYYKEEIMPSFEWHRLQMVAPNDELHERWASFLGFQKEGILRQWGHDKMDYVMWSAVR